MIKIGWGFIPMQLWMHWVVLLFTWILSYLSRNLWPRNMDLELTSRSDWLAAFMINPFQFLLAILFFIFFVLISSGTFKKMIYECMVARLLRRYPYEPFLILVLLCLMIAQVLVFYGYVAWVLAGCLSIFEGTKYMIKRKKEDVYVREESRGAHRH